MAEIPFDPTFVPEIAKTPETSKETFVLTMEQLKDFQRQAGLSEADFEHPWELDADAYRTLAWRLANIFCESKEGWGTEMTHSEYAVDPESQEPNAIALCLEIMKRMDEDADRDSWDEFCAFLERNSALIPADLRTKFKLLIGFNYGDKGSIVVDKDGVRLGSQEAFDSFPSEGSIGYSHPFKKNRDFTALLDAALRARLR